MSRATFSERKCPICGERDPKTLIVLESLPVFCNVLHADPGSARAAETGRFDAAFCYHCTHFFNAAYQEPEVGYSQSYENSLYFSPRFVAYADALAERLNRTYALEGKTIIDIGCGKGDFLRRLCLICDAKGVGFDRSFQDNRGDEAPDVRFVKDWFGETYAYLTPDLVCCRHVIEHLAKPVTFLRDIRSHSGFSANTVFYFEVPNALYTLRDLGIWDLIYEHVSYFTPTSLRAAVEAAGFEVIAAGTSFGDQYLFIEARIGSTASVPPRTISDLALTAQNFATAYLNKIGHWRDMLAARRLGRTIVWGAGSKGITFINVVPGAEAVAYLVDVNPYKQGRFAPRFGTPILAPDALSAVPVDSIIVMNPLYSDEISDTVRSLGLSPEIILA